MHKDILYCLPFLAQAMYNVLRDYVEKNKGHLVGFCTDGSPSMAKWLANYITQRGPATIWNDPLWASEPIGEILQQGVTMVNYIKPHPLHTRLLAKLYAHEGSMKIYCFTQRHSGCPEFTCWSRFSNWEMNHRRFQWKWKSDDESDDVLCDSRKCAYLNM